MPRLTIDVGHDFDKVLSDVATEKGTSKAEIIRRAVASYVYLGNETKNDNKVSISNSKDQVVKDVVLP
jgi:hypothetical protein